MENKNIKMEVPFFQVPIEEELEEDDYYNEQDFAQDRFYKIDKRLFENARYKGLSLGAKVVYGILKDRQCLSESNKKDWLDERGRIFFYFDCEKLSKLLEISTSTLNRHKRELEKYRLLSQTRQGQGRPNKMFCIKPKSIDNSLISQNDNPRKVKMTKLELSKRLGNETEFNETYINETNSYMFTTSEQCRNDLNYNSKDDYLKDIESHNQTDLTLEIFSLFYDKYLENNKNYNHYRIKEIDLHICTSDLTEIEKHLEDNYPQFSERQILKEYLNWYFETNNKHSIKNFASIKAFNTFFVKKYKNYLDNKNYFEAGTGKVKANYN